MQYKNRYGDVFTFTLTEKGILWEGNFEFHRFGWDDDPNVIVMVDPSGGPYLSVGQDMGLFDPEWRGMKISGFEVVKIGYLIKYELDKNTK